ncbi:hypothetical protein FGADI_4172 [Fusarium gaditjirri]|uniref:Uncharacterized protein n=1 Tax=Fusarium gaditjirri TaxID=282569 RepID=A0A8H4X004_9HYPO|nr:hypothetical protein FGADI_4172 [Fusarium gaditjirri]
MDCSPEALESLVSDELVEFDSDVAGPGVLAAFLVTSLIALATLILAFLTFSVPERLLSSGDAVIAAGSLRIYHRLRAKFPKTKRTKVAQSRKERTHAFMAFMIAISDQILVSQASILIAALIIHDDITIYSSNIVIALGCLASTVHLGSFPFYIGHLKDHSTAKLIRVLAMVVGSGILVFLLVVQLSYIWDMETHVYFTCTLQDYRMNEGMGMMDFIIIMINMFVPLTVLYGTYEIVQLLYRDQPVDDKPNGPGSRGESIFARQNREYLDAQQLLDSGSVELQTLARLEDQPSPESHRDPTDIDVESRAIVSILQLISENDMVTTTDNETSYQHQRSILMKPRGAKVQFKELLKEIKESKRKDLLNKWLKLKALTILTSNGASTRKLKLLIGLTAETWAFHQCRGSFAWRLCWLWSGNVYGIATIFTSRAVTTGMSGNPNEMGFGQAVPLTLLVLPVFAAMEGHADYKQKLKSIEKAHVNQANLETPVNRSTRFRSMGQSPTQRQNMLVQTEITSIQTVREILYRRSIDIGHPELFKWVTGEDLTSALNLQIGVAAHAAAMFTIATLLGFSMAYGIDSVNVSLVVILFLFAARRLTGLLLVGLDMRSCPIILDHLGGTEHLPSQHYGDHGERMATGQEAGDAGENVEEEDRQEET